MRDLWAALRPRWPLTGLGEVREALLEAYGDPGRGYHDLLHLTEVLDRLDELAATEPFDRHSVGLAAWFHDAVYDGSPDDEVRSADWARSALGGPQGTEVARLVLVTAEHRPEPDDHDGAVLCDADLAILAASPDRYAGYAAGVRAEYAAHSDAAFAAGRARILRDLLRGDLFHTESGRDWWDSTARSNLRRELVVLDEVAASSD